MDINIDNIQKVLQSIQFPNTSKNILQLCQIENVQLKATKLNLNLVFNQPNDPNIIPIKKTIVNALTKTFENKLKIKGNINVIIKNTEKKIFPSVKHVIAIASGKGGVGKSTVASNIAVTLAKLNYKVGLIDADIFGPSIPKMFNVEDEKATMAKVEGKNMINTCEKYGVKLLSIGFFINPQQAMVWRGPMASNAFKQLMEEGNWGNLDFVLIDLPPGTSDIHLTLAQSVSITGAIIVTTPQEVALSDAIKSVDMFLDNKIKTKILGIIENMSWFTPHEFPKNKYYIFGKNGGENLAKKFKLPLLGQIPIVQSICENGDNGKPSSLDNNTQVSECFLTLTKNIIKIIKNLNR